MFRHQAPAIFQRTIVLPDEPATLLFGAALAGQLQNGMLLFLKGDLGAGKTTLVRGVLRGLGFSGRVKSPTYTLVEPYTVSRINLYHFDLYRFACQDEWVDAGFRDWVNSNTVCLIEWPEKAGDWLPAPDLLLDLQTAGAGRSLEASAYTETGKSCLSHLEFPTTTSTA